MELRFPGETDEQFRHRLDRTAAYAKLLIDAALANHCVQAYIADPALPYSVTSERRSPTVRIDFEEAFAIAGIGEGLAVTRSKYWGDGPYIEPLRPDDPVDPMFIVYVYKAGSRYNRRFEQRRRLKELLGPRYRSLVRRATYKRGTKQMFLDRLTDDQAEAIVRLLNVDPATFWRLARGKIFYDLPAAERQLWLPFSDDAR